MRSYGSHPEHRPSPGPRQPSVVGDEDPGAHGERQRVLAIIADMGARAVRGEYDHVSRDQLLRIVYKRVLHDR
jgi:hypothetical protein